MKQLFILGLLACLSVSYGCGQGNELTTEAAREATVTDSELENQIETRFNSNTELMSADLSVDADADNNMATLSGTVASESLRTQAVQLARSAYPGITIEDKIQVRPTEMTREEFTEDHARQERERARTNQDSIGESVDDAWIHAKITTKLITDSDTPGRKINVDVDRNVVTLRGTVSTAAEKSEAERIATETEGVTRVVSQLRVGPAE